MNQPETQPSDPQKSGVPATKNEPPPAPDAPLDEVEEASEESFPASDAPSWSPTKVG